MYSYRRGCFFPKSCLHTTSSLFVFALIIYNLNLSNNPSIGINQKSKWFTIKVQMWLTNIPDQHCTNYHQEQIRLHLVGSLDSMQTAMFQPTIHTGLNVIVIYFAAKQKEDHLFSSSPSMVTIQGLTMITHYQKQSILMGTARFG